MPRLPISVCVIVRDDPLLEGLLKSVRDHVAEICIVDTGSEDPECIRIGKEYADRWERVTACNDPTTGKIRDFALARERSFSLATQRWVLWADSDDEIRGMERMPAILAEAERHRTPSTGVHVPFRYEYAYDGAGNCIYLHYRERLLSWDPEGARAGQPEGVWRQPVHEVYMARQGWPTAILPPCDEVVWSHRRQYSPKQYQDPGRNLRILRDHIAQVGDSDARLLYYLGVECASAGHFEEALTHLERYLDVSGWDEERAIAALKMADVCILNLDNAADHDGKALRRAIRWACEAIQSRENWAEGYITLARANYLLALKPALAHYAIRHYQRCVRFATIGLSMPPTRTMLQVDPRERAFAVHEFMNIALVRLGEYDLAIESSAAALAYQPDEPDHPTTPRGNMLYNQLLCREFRAREQAIRAIHEVRDIAEQLRLPRGPESRFFRHGGMTAEVAAELERGIRAPETYLPAKPQEATAGTRVPTPSTTSQSTTSRSGKRSIVFACGECWEDWNPKVVRERGMGGSETAVYEMARRFAKRGYDVRVYTSCGEGVTDEGVTYLPAGELVAGSTECDLLVAWRHACFLHSPIRAGQRWLWVHDVCAMGADQFPIGRADRVLALSDWHRQNLLAVHGEQGLRADRLSVTRNGIDLDRFDYNAPRNPRRAVYSSSPNRGLQALLQMWPRIRAQVPDAELDIFYGFFNWEAMARKTANAADLEYIQRLKACMFDLQDQGVRYRGRVRPDDLAREFLQAGAWLYPTWFTETSCITAMEAQAAGLNIVTSPIAALNETVGSRGAMVAGDWLSAPYQDRFVVEAVQALRGDAFYTGRSELQEYAREHFSWEGVVDQWEGWMDGVGTRVPVVVEADFPAYEAAP